MIQHPPHSVPLLSCVIAEPILEVHRTQNICDKDFLLLDMFFFLIPKKFNTLKKRKNWLDLFVEPSFEPEMEEEKGLSLIWHGLKRLCMSVKFFGE